MKKNAVVLLILFLIFILGLLILNGVFAPKNKNPLPSPTPFPSLNPGVFNSVPDKIIKTRDEDEADRRAFLVGKLINILPYSGVDFVLSFDYDSDSFLLTLNKNNIDKANEELNLFLSQNSIESKSWIENLIVSYK